MAYDAQFLKITWGFTVHLTDEVADTSLSYTSGELWTGAAAALANFDSDDVSDFLTPMLDLISGHAYLGWATYSHLKTIKLAAIATNGSYLAEPVIWEATDEGNAGTAGQVVPQATVVLSLRSGMTLGKGNFGRMYLPHTMIPLEATSPRGAMASASDIAADGVNFVNACTVKMNAVAGALMKPVIMTQTGGASKTITQVAVGRVTDTQRRRRNRLDEGYAFQAL